MANAFTPNARRRNPVGGRSRPSSNPGRKARPTLVNGDVAALTRFFDRDSYLALIRPDQIVGAIADPTKPDHAQFTAALGRHDQSYHS
jgi:hypothetical protein